MMTKRDFKILEAVHLGLTHYYTDHGVKVPVTADDKKWAESKLPTLPPLWWQEKHEWDACRRGR